MAGCLWALFIAFAGMGSASRYMGSPLFWALVWSPVVAIGLLYLRSGQFLEVLRGIGERWRWALPWWAFVLAIALAWALNAGQGVNESLSLSTMLKYGAFGVAFVVVMALRPTTTDLRNGLIFLMCASLLFFGASYLLDFPLVRMNNRLGWYGTWPGEIWKTSIYLWPWLVWRAFTNLRPSIVAGLLAAALLVALDGSRSGILVELVFIPPLLVIAAIVYKRPARSWVLAIFSIAASLALTTIVLQPLISNIQRYGAAAFISDVTAALEKATGGTPAVKPDNKPASEKSVVSPPAIPHDAMAAPKEPKASEPAASSGVTAAINKTTIGRLLLQDEVRVGMIEAGLAGVAANWPLGGGLGSTVALGYGKLEHVHITYLQILSDLGVLGFISYVLIFALPLTSFFLAFRKLRRGRPIKDWLDEWLLPLSVVAIFLIEGLTHPFGNEPSRWGVVLLSLALLANFGRSRHRESIAPVGPSTHA